MAHKNCAGAPFINNGQILFVLAVKKIGNANKYLGKLAILCKIKFGGPKQKRPLFCSGLFVFI